MTTWGRAIISIYAFALPSNEPLRNIHNISSVSICKIQSKRYCSDKLWIHICLGPLHKTYQLCHQWQLTWLQGSTANQNQGFHGSYHQWLIETGADVFFYKLYLPFTVEQENTLLDGESYVSSANIIIYLFLHLTNSIHKSDTRVYE